MIDSTEQTITVRRVLQTLPTSMLEPGLPKKEICASDHLSLVAELEINLEAGTNLTQYAE